MKTFKHSMTGGVMQNNLARAGSLQGKDVVMANALTRSAQGLNLAEKRIIFSVIANSISNSVVNL